MKKALMTATVASMLDNFNRGNIRLLLETGFEVTLAANFDAREDSSPLSRIGEFKEEMEALGCRTVQVDFSRRLKNVTGQLRSYRQLKQLAEEKFDLVHCNSPICAAMTRLAFRKYRKANEYGTGMQATLRKCRRQRMVQDKPQCGTRVIYTAHGFHFYKGAPVINWIIYFPVETWLSRLTDVLITINEEDYIMARKYMHSGAVEHIPGTGIDTEKFSPYILSPDDRRTKRQKLGIPEGSFVLLSVGELQTRKNHRVVIEAVRKLKNPRIIYLIAGCGELEEEYRRLIIRNGLTGTVRLLGYRTDIAELCGAADCFIHPSVREGLGIAPLEAMSCGLPLISSWVNGMRDYTEDGKTGCCIDPKSVDSVKEAIMKMYGDARFRSACGRYNAEAALAYSKEKSMAAMRRIYEREMKIYEEKETAGDRCSH